MHDYMYIGYWGGTVIIGLALITHLLNIGEL